MASRPTQIERKASLSTPLGNDVLVLARFNGREGLSELFDFTIEAVSEQAGVDFNGALGRSCCVTYKTFEDVERHFNGILTEAQWLGQRVGGLHAYRLVLRPWLHLLSFSADSHTFENKSVKDIITNVFSDAGFSDFRFDTTEDYPPLEYCVQYRESHAAFVMRLMEHHGLYYFFEHSTAKHELVIADAKASHKPVPNLARMRYIALTEDGRRAEQHVSDWTPTRRFRTGKVVLKDYNFKTPNAPLKVEHTQPGTYEKGSLEVFDYPGTHEEDPPGEKFAKARVQALQATDERRETAGDAASLLPGGLVTVFDHPVGSENGEYIVVRAVHALGGESYTSGRGAAREAIYSGFYELQPSSRPYKAPVVTPKPLIHGIQTAKVVGDNGGALGIDVDEHGRILVHFHWERTSMKSRRVRVGQVWADKQWGGIYTPRIGQEVIVTFLEGDPDQPLVIGAVYNEDNKHPYKMPGEKTWSGVKSKTVKFSKGYNEFVFDDGESGPLLRMYADKDQEMGVGNDEKRTIERDQKTKIGRNQDVDIGNTLTVTAGQKIVLKVGASTITMDPTSIKIESLNITVKGNAKLDATAPLTTVNGDGTLTLTGGVILIN